MAKAGDENLAKMCARIAGDESRHEQFYVRMMAAVLERDPEHGVMIFREMMRRVISMPGKNMHDGKDPDLFEHFALVAQRSGVYTVTDYAQIIGHLVETWKIASLSLSGPAAKAQEFLCKQSERLGAMAERLTEEVEAQPRVAFKWIYDRSA